jgi:hypothetical protein
MPRRRRFAAVAVLAVLGAMVLTGCGQAQPGTAAYVGNTRYTERQLDDIVEEIRSTRPEVQPPEPRAWALSRLILLDLARRVVEEQKLTVPSARYDEFARGLRLPADSKFVRLWAEYEATKGAVAAAVQPVTPTEDDFRAIWDVLRKDPRLIPGTTYAYVVEVLRGDTRVPVALGVRNVLQDQAADTDVVVNPVYQPLLADVEIGDAPVTVLLGDDAGFVSDLASG